MNEMLNNILTRRSVRSYKNEPVSEENIRILIDAANNAPSGKYKMPRHYIVVTDRKKLDAIADNHPHAQFLKQAPLAIVVCGSFEQSPDYWQADCSAAAENILLAANALGLGSCWCCINPHKDIISYFKYTFSIPDGIEAYAMAVVGTAEQFVPKTRTLRQEIVHYNEW